jgi:uncharacterized protein (TIGR02646 family)
MIFVDRNTVLPPAELLDFHQREVARLRPVFESLKGAYSQVSIDFSMPQSLRKKLRDKLVELFQGKCAFCERLGSEIEHFRPRWRASRMGGSIDPGHYWWLASDWENLYLCCRACNARKMNFFPISGELANPMTYGQALLRERPLLIDPCQDNPRDHLEFLGSGEVIALTEKGAITIKVFQLNEPILVDARRHRAMVARAICEQSLPPGAGAIPEDAEFRDVLSSRHPHFAVTQQIVDAFITPPPTVQPIVPAEPVAVPEALNKIPDVIWLEDVEIRNFKVISELELSFPPLQTDGENVIQPWLMVLGENGVGKSSLLQAIALTMSPATDLGALDARAWLRKGKGILEGFVRLVFSDRRERVLTFKKGDEKFHVKGDLPELPVLAYGSTRLLPSNSTAAPASPTNVSVRNLFDHTHPLAHVERYLCNKRKINESQFNLLATSLKALLPLDQDAELKRAGGFMKSQIDGKPVSLSELSDGYKSVLALAMDIMFHLTNSSFDMESAQGIVMIDELELHLHPRWKLQIVERLRQLFPRVRFVASTHDPLCVHGLKAGELWVMAKHPQDKKFILEQIDVPPGTRADEVLTGPWFGLQSTIDADTLNLMSEHSVLLQQDSPNLDRLAKVETTLRQRMVTFGSTRAQRAALAAAAVLDTGIPETQANQLIRHRLQNILGGGAGESQEGGDA